jgi:hypothetical protein
MDHIVDTFRKIIVLVEEASLDTLVRERVSMIGRVLFQHDQR